MYLIYLGVDGSARLERAAVRERLIEMPDGIHPVTNDSVWQDAKRIRQPAMVFIQGVRAAYGSTMEAKDIELVLYDLEVKERALKKPKISKMWVRTLAAIGRWFLTYWTILMTIILIAYGFYSAFSGG